ncbi:MAG: hypothetical protein JW849_03440 [Phycisphaerae bacterium]|nr:hypothetical protein [Phycisphaerae bacterium]
MKRIARAILAHPPRRRRRMWKYVSPRRRRVGLLLLALLLALVYAGWYFTRSSHIRREAKRALEALTGADVDVDDASFRLFEGIRLFHVRVRMRDDDEHFFTAEEVLLKHKPASLVFQRRIEPTEIVCLRPMVNLEYEENDSNAERLFRLASSRPREGENRSIPLPRIVLKDGLLRSRVRREGRVGPVVEEQFTAVLQPKEGRKYEVTVQGPRRGGGETVEWARLVLDAETGTIRPISGSATERWFVHMPPEYRTWIDRYDFRGEFTLLEGEGTDPQQGRYEIALEDFSMKLPESEGNLTLSEVRGRLRFTKTYVEMHQITGRVEEAGRAVFTLNGRYDGYAKDSPFQARIDIRGVRFPDEIRGPLAKIVATVRREFRPDGKADVSMTFRRDEQGQNHCDGQLKPRDAKMTYRRFPLPVDHVRGAVHFTRRGADRVSLTARRGAATFTIDGELRRDQEHRKTLYDVRVSGKNVPLDAAVRNALPEQYHKVWNALHPSGTCDVDVHVVKNEPLVNATVDVDFHMKGFTGVTFDAFAYPLKNLFGEVTLRGKDVTILEARSRDGRMTVHAEGTVRGLTTKDLAIDLNVRAARVPMDKTLLGAVKGNLRSRLKELQPGGEIRRLTAHVTKQGSQPVDYDILADLEDASFCYKQFPYAVRNAAGEVQITPPQAVLRDVQGAHGEAKVTISGTIDLQNHDARQPGYDLAIQADDVTLGREFHEALPPKLREVWKSLSPAGRADFDATLRSTGDDTPLEYRVAVETKDASLRYEDFPYTFRHVAGRAVVTPGVVNIEKMQSRQGEMQADVSGVIRHTPDGARDVTLHVSAQNLPIDKEFLAAVPKEVVPLIERIAPGGKVDAELKTLHIRRPPNASTQPGATNPPTSAPSAVAWNAEGNVTFRDLVLDIGFGPKKMTGRIVGKAGQEGRKKLALDARAELSRLAFKHHEIIDLKGRLIKRAESDTLQVNNISGRAYDGKIDGELTIRLKEPLHYELSASVWNVDLGKFVNANQPDPKKWANLNGLLSGRLSMEAAGGKRPTRQITGELILSRGRLFELPVFLGLVNVVYLQLPGESAFNRGFVNYHLKNDILRFSEIYLTGWDRQTNMGKGISILGSGTLNVKNEKLDLTFLTGPPGDLPRLGEITEDLLEALSRSLVEVRVTGTLKKPKMDTVPLSPLATIIRRLLEPSLKTE